MTRIHVLIVEDSEDDTELLLHELRNGNFDPMYVRVETGEAMRDALAERKWDMVVSDFSMPHFNAFAALGLVHDSKQDIPFIIVSGTIGEDRAVEAMKLGAHDYILKNNLKRFLPAVERELREAKIREERQQTEITIRLLAFTDPITELPNRIRFRELLQETIQQSQQNHVPVALLLLDLNHFKNVNDTLGHSSGDILLQLVGKRLRNALRVDDVVARLGGDEFGILLPRLGAIDDVKQVVKNIHDCLLPPFMIEKIPVVVETSIGVAIMPTHADNMETLLQHADIAMYCAKKNASDYTVYDESLNLHSPAKLSLMAELRDAIQKNQLLLHFQPKLNLKSGRIVGSEALVRWQHPRLGLVMPDAFIAAAEQTGLIDPLTHWVLTEALKQCQSAKRDGFPLRVSVNLSARSLHHQGLPNFVAVALAETGAQPHQLMLEVTESAIVLDPARAEANLVKLSQMGIMLSIDDFGTGYTSLSSIKRLPVHEIKIDKSFVTNMLTDQKDAMIVRSVIDLGHNFGMTVVAEGVETKEVYDALVAIGCDQIQGYYISRPQSCEQLKIWFASCPYPV